MSGIKAPPPREMTTEVNMLRAELRRVEEERDDARELLGDPDAIDYDYQKARCVHCGRKILWGFRHDGEEVAVSRGLYSVIEPRTGREVTGHMAHDKTCPILRAQRAPSPIPGNAPRTSEKAPPAAADTPPATTPAKDTPDAP